MAPKSLCLTTAVAPAPAFLGRSCPLGCSLSAPATGGFSVVSPQYIRYAAAPRKRSGPPAHFMGYHSTIVRILQEGGGITWADGLVVACALLQRMVCFGLRRCPTCPPSNVFRNRGTPPAPPGGALGSLHPPWRDEEGAVVPPSPPSDAFGNRGLTILPRKQRPLHPVWGTEEAVFSHLARRDTF